MTTLDRATVDHLLTTTRAVRKRLDLESAGRARGDRGVPAARDPGADRWQLAGLALDRRHRSRQARSRSPTRTARMLGAVHRGEPRPPRPTPIAQQQRVVDSASYLADHLHEVPVHVIPCIYGRGLRRRRAGRVGRPVRLDLPRGVELPARAAQPRARLGVHDAAPPVRGARRRSCSASPTGVIQTALIPVAYFTGDDFQPAVRRPVEEITYWNGWKQPRAEREAPASDGEGVRGAVVR